MNSDTKKQLKSLAHSLKPTVTIGQAGLTEPVIKEIEIALNYHELIKIKIRAEKEDRKEIQQQIMDQTHSELIQSIGQIIAIYRKNPDKNTKK